MIYIFSERGGEEDVWGMAGVQGHLNPRLLHRVNHIDFLETRLSGFWQGLLYTWNTIAGQHSGNPVNATHLIWDGERENFILHVLVASKPLSS